MLVTRGHQDLIGLRGESGVALKGKSRTHFEVEVGRLLGKQLEKTICCNCKYYLYFPAVFIGVAERERVIKCIASTKFT